MPDDWIIIGYRHRTAKVMYVPWMDSTSKPIAYYTDLREEGLGTTAIKVNRNLANQTVTEYLMFKVVDDPTWDKQPTPFNRFSSEEEKQCLKT